MFIAFNNMKQLSGSNILMISLCIFISGEAKKKKKKKSRLSLDAARGKVMMSLKTKELVPLGACMCSPNFMAICFLHEDILSANFSF